MPARSAFAATAALGLALMTLPGCLVVSGHETDITGAYVSNTDSTRVKLGSATIDEAIDILGDPTSRKVEEDREVLSWTWTKRTEEGGAVLLVFAGGSSKTVTETLNIEFKDGVASRRWRD